MDYLSSLNTEQRQAVEHISSPLLILAGAGSGKTRVITTKIAWLIQNLQINPHQILAVTFTKKAANEMQERAVQLEPSAKFAQIKTFHSFGAWFLRIYGEEAKILTNFTVYDDDDMTTLVSKANPKLTRQMAKHFAHSISLAKDYCFTPQDIKELQQIDAASEFPQIYENYQTRLRQTGNVDFGDLIMLPYQILKQNQNIKEMIQDRFSVIMVDEYQDSNIAQFLLLKELKGPQSHICVVGDDDQSIYKFRGAEIQNILQFQNQFEGTQIVRLQSNYRSKEEILTVADDVVKNNTERLGKTLKAERGKGKIPVLAFLPNQDEEVAFCADLILQSKKSGVSFKEWAILYRTNAQSLGFESEFLHRKIPYTVVGTLKFYEREEIKDLLSYLSFVANDRDEIAFRRIINKPTRGIGETTQNKIVESFRTEFALDSSDATYISTCKKMALALPKKAREGLKLFVENYETFIQKLNENDKKSEENQNAEKQKIAPLYEIENLSVLVEMISEKSGLKEFHATEDEIAGTQRVSNMIELANAAVLYECTTAGLLEFLDHIELDRNLETSDDENATDRVTLITLHNTKGLEFDRVIITGMEYGVFPRIEKTGEDLEEERRLCYVGITRAKNELYFTSCQSRRMYGRTEFLSPSPFLKEIDSSHLKILGRIPQSFRPKNSNTFSNAGEFGKYGLSHPNTKFPLIQQKYRTGTKIFHDDYGYGIVTKTSVTDEEEFVITVNFESGMQKKFLPQYQEKSLMVVKD